MTSNTTLLYIRYHIIYFNGYIKFKLNDKSMYKKTILSKKLELIGSTIYYLEGYKILNSNTVSRLN